MVSYMDETAAKPAETKNFLKGTLILTVSSIVVKVIGALNWVILSRIMGGEGIGLYQMGFPITIFTPGLAQRRIFTMSASSTATQPPV